MKFLLDVNASGSLVNWLVGLGHDVIQVADKDPRMLDEDIRCWALHEQRIIITTDRDFEEMIWREGKEHLWGVFGAGAAGVSGDESTPSF